MTSGNDLASQLARANALISSPSPVIGNATAPADSTQPDALQATIEDATFEEKAKTYAPLFDARKRVGDFPDPKPDEDNESAIFKTRYLRKGGMMLLVSTLGVGKSTFVSQGSECWARGLDFFGFTPARPLSIGVFETEDDADEIADFRNNFRRGFSDAGWTELETAQAESGDNAPFYYPSREVPSDKFLDYLEYCQAKARHDLIIINPAYDFISGDISKQEAVSTWKARIFALMEKYHFAVLLVHHTNKVPNNAKDREQWLTGTSAAYAGSGSMVLPSSARAVVFIRPLEKRQGVFAMIAAKRGKRLGWKDRDGNPTVVKYIAHSDGYIFWRDATPEEVIAVSPKEKENGQKIPDGAQRIMNACKENGAPFASVSALEKVMIEKYGVSKESVRSWKNKAIDLKLIKTGQGRAGGEKPIGLPSQFPEESDNDDED